jgi:hypothetical protein
MSQHILPYYVPNVIWKSLSPLLISIPSAPSCRHPSLITNTLRQLHILYRNERLHNVGSVATNNDNL